MCDLGDPELASLHDEAKGGRPALGPEHLRNQLHLASSLPGNPCPGTAASVLGLERLCWTVPMRQGSDGMGELTVACAAFRAHLNDVTWIGLKMSCQCYVSLCTTRKGATRT